MRHSRRATLEDLPPLELRKVRDLHLDAPAGPDRRAHVSAASGVVRRGDFLYVVGDDELHLGVFRVSSLEPGTLRRALGGDLPADPAERKRRKPDLEVLTLLPPYPGRPFGALLGLGSGSTDDRDRGFTWDLAADGSLRGEPSALDLSPLYDLLRAELGELNVEGATLMDDRLWLLNRGAGDTPNAIAQLEMADVLDTLLRDRRFDAAELAALHAYELGAIDGAMLTFSDATPLGGGILVFTASAERTSNTYDDGEIAGSVLGLIDQDGEVARLRTIDRAHKVEGVHASLDTGVLDLLLVADQDDSAQPAPLLSAAMPLDGSVERA